MKIQNPKVKHFLKWLVVITTATVVLVVVIPAILLGGYTIWVEIGQPRGTCNSVPIALDKANNSISCEVSIWREDSYGIELRYVRTNENINHIRNVIGSASINRYGNFVDPGVPISVHVIIKDSSTNYDIVNAQVDNPHLTSHTSDSFYTQLIGAGARLKRGRYQVIFTNLYDSPQMTLIPTRMEFRNTRTK